MMKWKKRLRKMDRRERREDKQARRQSGFPLPLSLLDSSLSSTPQLVTPPCSISQKLVGSALSRQACMLKRERKGAAGKSKVLKLEIKFLLA